MVIAWQSRIGVTGVRYLLKLMRLMIHGEVLFTLVIHICINDTHYGDIKTYRYYIGP